LMVKTLGLRSRFFFAFFLNRGGLIGKRGNIPSGERAAGYWGGSGHGSLRTSS
jgi:hypothetical protein